LGKRRAGVRKVPNVPPGGKRRSPAPFATERRAKQKLASSKLKGNAQSLKAIDAIFVCDAQRSLATLSSASARVFAAIRRALFAGFI
jgi:hypothetical protein